MFARQLDTGFAGAVRGPVTDPATGLAGRDPEGALAGIDTAVRTGLSDLYAGAVEAALHSNRAAWQENARSNR